jgi:TPR repeat protein
VPIYDFAKANEDLAKKQIEAYYPCCGKSVCGGCFHSFRESGNMKCPFCNSDRADKTDEDGVEEIMKRVEANDTASICTLAGYHLRGLGVEQDHAKAMKLYARAADLDSSNAQFQLGNIYHEGGDLKKAKFHWEAAAMAGDEEARYNLGSLETQSGNMGRAVKHWIIAASAGYYHAMQSLRESFKRGHISRDAINSILTAYNNSCAEMRSEARDSRIRAVTETM